MARAEYTLTDVMLTHAAITYRGFALLTEDRARLREAMTRCLQSLDPVKERWDIVWGPASFRSELSLFDDAAMYVAQSRAQPSCFVVAVRGTNPLSLFDWVFGDLLTRRQVPWPYGTGPDVKDARVSFSTALGLRILQNMRWEPSSSILQRVRAWLAARAAELRRRLKPDVSEPLRRLSNALQAQLPHLGTMAAQLATAAPDGVAQRIREFRAAQSACLDEAFGHQRDTPTDRLRLILSGSELLRPQLASGDGL
jgi:hypothetical protein